MSEVFGLDVSHYQGAIDWKKVAGEGKKFVIMKCMYEAQSHRIDETFEANYRGAGIYGLARGVYIFIARASIADPVADAKALLGHLRDRPLEYGIWLDYESDALKALGADKIRELTYIYANMFRAAGYYVGIYCNKYWYDNIIHPELKKEFDFWIARYPLKDDGLYHATSKLRPNLADAVAWQYSSKGHINGINAPVDMDVDFDGVVSLIAREPHRKTNEEIAKEVLTGLWGTKDTKPTRKELLTRAGYDYEEIRKLVNQYYKK